MPHSFSDPSSVSQHVERLDAVPVTLSPAALVELILAEGAIGLSQAAKLVGTYRNGAGTSPSTLARWASSGTPLDNGEVVRLQVVKIAGRLMTSRARLVAFIARQNEQPASGALAVQPNTPARRQRAKAAASAELDAAIGAAN